MISIVNDIQNKKGFKNFSTIENISTMWFQKEDIFLTSSIDNTEKSLGYFQTVGSSLPNNKIDKQSFDVSNKKNKIDLRNLKDKLKKEEKIFYIDASLQFYHFVAEIFAFLLLLHKKYPNSFFVINYSFISAGMEKENSFLKLLKDFISNNNIKYVLLEQDSVIALNNFYYFTEIYTNDEAINLLYNFSQKYVKNKDVLPTKKVFLSRKYTPCERYGQNKLEDIMKKWAWIDKDEKDIIGISDIRLHGETEFCHFMQSIGYEIVYPEKFATIEEQINFFNDVKIIVSTTSSSLLNSVFMQPGGVVVDLMTPMFPGTSPYFELHNDLYLYLSYIKKHHYIGIPNKYNSDELVDYITSNNTLMQLLRG